MCRTRENAIDRRDGNRIRERFGATLLGRTGREKYSKNVRLAFPNSCKPRLTI
jgi:hypothetical protein